MRSTSANGFTFGNIILLYFEIVGDSVFIVEDNHVGILVGSVCLVESEGGSLKRLYFGTSEIIAINSNTNTASVIAQFGIVLKGCRRPNNVLHIITIIIIHISTIAH